MIDVKIIMTASFPYTLFNAMITNSLFYSCILGEGGCMHNKNSLFYCQNDVVFVPSVAVFSLRVFFICKIYIKILLINIIHLQILSIIINDEPRFEYHWSELLEYYFKILLLLPLNQSQNTRKNYSKGPNHDDLVNAIDKWNNWALDHPEEKRPSQRKFCRDENISRDAFQSRLRGLVSLSVNFRFFSNKIDNF